MPPIVGILVPFLRAQLIDQQPGGDKIAVRQAVRHALPQMSGAELRVPAFLNQRGLRAGLPFGGRQENLSQHVLAYGADAQALDALRASVGGDAARVPAPYLFGIAARAVKELHQELSVKGQEAGAAERGAQPAAGFHAGACPKRCVRTTVVKLHMRRQGNVIQRQREQKNAPAARAGP